MVPDADLQLAAAIKALRDVVAPAVDPANRLAIEQLHLTLATLDLVRTGLPRAHGLARRELTNALDLAGAVQDAEGEVAAAMGDAKAALDDPTADAARLDTVRLTLLEQVEGAVANSAGTAAGKAVAKAVVRASKAQTDLARSWCLPAGFETVATLPPVDTLLG